MQNATFYGHFLADFDSVCFMLIGHGAGFKTNTQNVEIALMHANLCKFIQRASNTCMGFSIAQAILILFGLSDRPWSELQN